jgi:hypothetical protein
VAAQTTGENQKLAQSPFFGLACGPQGVLPIARNIFQVGQPLSNRLRHAKAKKLIMVKTPKGKIARLSRMKKVLSARLYSLAGRIRALRNPESKQNLPLPLLFNSGCLRHAFQSLLNRC